MEDQIELLWIFVCAGLFLLLMYCSVWMLPAYDLGHLQVSFSSVLISRVSNLTVVFSVTTHSAPVSHWTGQLQQMAELGHLLSYDWTCAAFLLQPLLMLQTWSRSSENCQVHCACTQLYPRAPSHTESAFLQVIFLGEAREQLQTEWVGPAMAAAHSCLSCRPICPTSGK